MEHTMSPPLTRRTIQVLQLFALLVPVKGCTDYTLRMFDSYGDGWNQNSYIFYTTDGAGSYATGTLPSGYYGTETICLVDDCYVLVVDGGEWDYEISWDFYYDSSNGFFENGTAPMVLHFCANAGNLSASTEDPHHNVSFKVKNGFTNDADGYFLDAADCYVKVTVDNVTLKTSTQYDDRTPTWNEWLEFHSCTTDSGGYLMQMSDSDEDSEDDLILGPWYSTLAFLHGHQIHNNDKAVTWMLWDTDYDYVIFRVDVTMCATHFPGPTAAPSAAPSAAPTHAGFVRPTVSPTSSANPTAHPTSSLPTTAPTLAPTPVVDSVTLLHPDSSTIFYAGQENNITWEYTGDTGTVSLFLFRDGSYHSKIAFMISDDVNTTCDRDKLSHHVLDDDDCYPVLSHSHDGVVDDTYIWLAPADIESDITYTIELYTSLGLYSTSDMFMIVAAPTPAPTSTSGSSSSAGADDSASVSGETIAVALVSAFLGAALMGVAFMSYRSWKRGNGPTAWLYDTHIAMEGIEDPASREVELQGSARTPSATVNIAIAEAVIVPPGKEAAANLDGIVVSTAEVTEVQGELALQSPDLNQAAML